jgi:diaminohydroxyphosphoribosylaminopyrimidine deaminase/5-amino-6-(5-phosphoribosylamino)uracil reductase
MDATELMLRAVKLARRGLGQTAPNPCVGALLVADGQVMAEGWHARYGGPHAEVAVIAEAQAKGVDPAACDLFVTLEPCNHHGKTPPCTEAVLAAGIRRVFIGMRDPNPDVTGGGADYLRDRGVAVELGVAEEACRDLIADFLTWKTTTRTYNFLKMAMTIDGKIAGRDGLRSAVSSEASLARVQELRCRVDAVVIGGSTFRADDPRLTCRQDVGGKDPYAVVVTGRLPERDAAYHLLTHRASRTIFWTSREAEGSARGQALLESGIRVWGLPEKAGHLDLAAGFSRLRRELTAYHTLCEGGGRLAMSLVEQGLADELWLFVAPKIVGDEAARHVFAGGPERSIAESLRFRVAGFEQSGADVLMIYRPWERS